MTGLSFAPPTRGTLCSPLLRVRNLTIEVPGNSGWVPAVEHVSFDVDSGTTVGLVGESGSGKTLASLAILGLIPMSGGRIADGTIRFGEIELTSLNPRAWRAIRGRRIAMVFQEPMRALNPAFTVGAQVAEVAKVHLGLSRKQAWNRAVDLLGEVGIPHPKARAHDRPFAFSGGMAQRVMVAMALAGEPELLLADEPTTALDVTVQADILALLRRIQVQHGLAMLFVSHDLGVIAGIADSVAVMYAGQIVERGPTVDLFERPAHPYTTALLRALPQARRTRRLDQIPGSIPGPGEMPVGCRFGPRCEHAVSDQCCSTAIALRRSEDGRESRCARVDELCRGFLS